LRNAYAKVGMFGTSGRLGDGRHRGAQLKGFGYLHDGSIATLMDFFASPTFSFPAPQAQNRADVVRFVMAADSNLAPVVGQQVTVAGDSPAALRDRWRLLQQRAAIIAPRPECDLMARAVLDGTRFSALYDGAAFRATTGAALSGEQLLERALLEGNVITLTCLPPGTGSRIALDRATADTPG
jgi:hypothetical protein